MRFVNQIKKAYSSVKKSIENAIPKSYKKQTKTITPEKEGINYLAANVCMPFQLKAGEHHASFDIKNRLKTLNCTSVSDNFTPICVIKSKHCGEIERKIHEKFSKYRINARREFFGFKIGVATSSTEFEFIKNSYDKLLRKMVKKMHKYAAKYGGEIIG